MPAHLRVALLVLVTAFDRAAAVRFGRPFHVLPQAKRVSYLAWWEGGPIRAQRDMVRFFRSLLVFALYSQPGRE